MKKMLGIAIFLFCVCAFVQPSFAGWADVMDKATDLYEDSTSDKGAAGSDLSRSEIVQGLRAALEKAAKASVDFLGQKGGYLDNPEVRIPMPESLGTVESALRLAGQEELADSFVKSMNRAAERAVPETLDIFKQTVKDMSFKDARGILEGDDTAATDFFRRNASDGLRERIRPIVSEAMDSVNVTRYYSQMTSAARMAGFGGSGVDLQGYVTEEAMDGLFLIMEREERSIRKDPVARTSEILKKVFGR